MDLRVRLLTRLLVGACALLAVGIWVFATSLRQDVQGELDASRKLVQLLMQAEQSARTGDVASLQALKDGIAQGGLRHVQVDWVHPGEQQLSQFEAPTSWETDGPARALGLGDWDFPEYRMDLGHGERLVIRMDPRSEVSEGLEDGLRMLGVFALFAAVSMVAAWWAADRALRPVRALEEGLARIGRGELQQPLPDMELREYQRVALAINHLAASLARAQAGERRLGQRLMALQETEREELARELHDEFGQSLAAMGAAAAFVERHASTAAPATLVECARDVRQASSRMAFQVRSRLRQLRPHGLDHMGLREAITDLVYGSRLKAEGVSIETRLPDAFPTLPAPAGLALYRTVQEALTNVLRHSGARHVRLEISATAAELRMTLEDDGSGRPDAVMASARAGVMGMHERAAMAGGRFALGVSPMGGLRVRLCLPVNPTEQEGVADGECAFAG